MPQVQATGTADGDLATQVMLRSLMPYLGPVADGHRSLQRADAGGVFDAIPPRRRLKKQTAACHHAWPYTERRGASWRPPHPGVHSYAQAEHRHGECNSTARWKATNEQQPFSSKTSTSSYNLNAIAKCYETYVRPGNSAGYSTGPCCLVKVTPTFWWICKAEWVRQRSSTSRGGDPMVTLSVGCRDAS